MQKDPNTLLLFAGLLRTMIWVAGIYIGTTIRKVLPTAGTFIIIGFSMATVTALINSFSQAGFVVDDTIKDLAVYFGWILAACLVTGVGLVGLFLTRLKKRLPGMGNK